MKKESAILTQAFTGDDIPETRPWIESLEDRLLYKHLEHRIGTVHLRQRLGIETDYEAKIFSQRLKFFHLERWYSVHALIHVSLQLALLRKRARENVYKFQLKHNQVKLAKLPQAFDGFTILQLSDPHLDLAKDFPSALSEQVHGLDYDICVLTGDFRYRTFGPYEDSLSGLDQLRLRLKEPVYGVLGNHDSIRMVPAMERMGVQMLLNESTTLNRGGHKLHLIGVDDPHYFRTDNLDRACRYVNHEEVSVLLSHTPEIYEHAAHAGIDLVLCGHTHGGQLCLPGGWPIIYDANCPRRMAAGVWTHHDLIGYTSVGAGSSIVPLRLNCLPEITLHTLRCK